MSSPPTTIMATNPTHTQDHSPAVLSTHSRRTAETCCAYALPHLRELYAKNANLRILDVGCGPGSITLSLAAIFPEARVVGIEHPAGAVALEAARALAKDRGITNTTFLEADLFGLVDQFGDHSFDVVHTHQVLQHCGSQPQALDQFRRLTAPGGFVACRTADLSATTSYPLSPDGLQLWSRAWVTLNPDTRAGSMQHMWAREAGFDMTKASIYGGAQVWRGKAECEGWATELGERVTKGVWADNLVAQGIVALDDRPKIVNAIEAWAREGADDAYFAILNGEMVLRV